MPLIKKNADMPEVGVVRELLGMLYDRDVTVAPQRGNTRLDPKSLVVALYRRRRDNSVSALCAADLEFASSAGAALTMIPPRVAAEAVRDGEVQELFEENIFEVFNILSRTFEASLGSCVLEKIFYPGDEVPQTVVQVLRANHNQVNRVAVEATISGYAKGSLTAITT